MHAISISIFAAALMGTVVTAQTTTVTDLFLVGFDYGYNSSEQAPYVGSVIASVGRVWKPQNRKAFLTMIVV